MAGLREQQKQARRDAIFRAAATLFAARGYAAATVDDIAAQAGLSVPTLYVYVGSKANLVVELYARDRALIDADKQAIINDPGEDAGDAILRMLLVEMRNGQDYLGHDIWREIVATSIRRTGDFQEGLDRLNARVFDEPLDRLLRVLRRRGQLAANIDISAVVAFFSDLVMAVFHQELAHDHPWPWVEDRIARHVKTAMAGLKA